MRRSRYFPMVVIGLASFAGQTAMLNSCRAWDTVPAAFISDPAYSQPIDGRNIDEAVQQAGFYDSRPRPNSSSASAQTSTSNRGGAQYRGQKLKMPTLPFGRQTTTNQSVARVPQSSGPNGAPNNAVRTQSRVTAQSSSAGRAMSQRMPGAAPTSNNFQSARVADGRSPQPIRQDSALAHSATRPNPAAQAGRSATPATPIPNSSSVSPWNTAPPAKPASQSLKPTAAAPTARSTAALSPADRLVAEAHELSTNAQMEQDYTHIIETCRRAQASQASPGTAQYANSLISWSLNRRGQLKAEAGENKEAILDFSDAVRIDPTCWRALHNRGVLLAQAGQFEKAFDDFTHTIQINPQFAKAYSNRAALFMVADNLDSALVDYKRAIGLDANLAVAHRGCGRVCQLLGRIDEAVAHYDAAVQLAPDDGYAAACRADLLTDIGRYADAVAEYDRAIKLDPSSSQAQGGLAWLLATCPDSSVRNADLAIERAKTVIEQGGEKEAVNYDTLAAAQASAGDFASAMDSVRQAIQLAPAEERDAYKNRLTMYQQAKPYRIAPVERVAQQVSYETTGGGAGVAR